MYVPLGVLPKNESSNEHMMNILETIQNKFVPLQNNLEDPQSTDKIPAELVFVGGDQLTKERNTTFRRQGQTEGQPWRGWMQRGLKMKIGMSFVLATR